MFYDNRAIEALIAKINELEQQVERLRIDPTFGCLSRQGLDELLTSTSLDGKVVVFFDLDKMHELNEVYGYQEVDRRIRAVLAQFRASEVVVGRWYSGDEIVLIVPYSEQDAVVNRLKVALDSQELSATIALSPISGEGADACYIAIRSAASKVQQAKARGDRGSVVQK